MKVLRIVMRSSRQATIYLRPGWLAQLFGAQDVVCELQRGPNDYPNEINWHHRYTGRALCMMPYGDIMTRALEFQPLDAQKLLEMFQEENEYLDNAAFSKMEEPKILSIAGDGTSSNTTIYHHNDLVVKKIT